MPAASLQTPTPELSYSRQDWQRGYESQPEEQDYEITDIEGQIPAALHGTFFRNGPGLLDINGTPIHHPFDGDGMISAFRFDQGRAHYRNRFVRTKGYVTEQQTGKICYRGVFGTQKPGGPLANAFDLNFKNIANTNIIYWAGKLLALWEAAEPHRLDPATLDTFGIDRLDGLLNPGDPFAAHPRFDPGSPFSNGQPRLVNFAVRAGLSSTLKLYEFDTSGKVVAQQAKSFPGFAFMHDFALTPNYYVFMQNPVRLNPLPFLFGFKGAGQCLQSDTKLPTRILLIPRDPSLPLQTYETDPCFVFHHANAFEQDGKVILDSICYAELATLGPDIVFQNIDFDSVAPGKLCRFEVDLSSGKVDRRFLDQRTCEFPTLNPAQVGQNARYLYYGATQSETGNAPLQAIAKLDLHSDEHSNEHSSHLASNRQLRSFAPRSFINEPVFVPHPQAEAEDHGWLLVLIYNAARHASDLVILDARNLETIATLKLQKHIPYGLHGSFVPQVF